MNILPIAGFYWKHGAQINALFSKTSDGSGSSLLLDVLTALAPVIKNHWPQFNENNLIDDLITTVNEVVAPTETTQYHGGPHAS